MFSDVSDRMPRKVRIASETTAMTSLLETGCLPPLGSVVGCVGLCYRSRCRWAGYRLYRLLPVVTGCYRLLPVVGVLLHESQGFGQGAYRGFALVHGQPAEQLA